VRIFPLIHDDPGAHPPFCTMGSGLFWWVKWRGVASTTHSIYSQV